MSRQFRILSAVFVISNWTAIVTHAQSFSDDFNRPDGPVSNGWSPFGGGAAIASGQLQTFGSLVDGGGVWRVFTVGFPLKFSFDFSTQAAADGGWFIAFNAQSTVPPGSPVGQVAFFQFAGSRNMFRNINDPSQASPNLPEPVPGFENFGGSPAHVQGVVNADLSAVIKVTYADGHQVTGTWGATTAGPIGDMLVLGNPNASNGPHIFDNFQVGPAGPLYHECLLYDSAKAVKSGATIPIKLQLCDANGNDLSSASVMLHAVSVTQTSTSDSSQVLDAGHANPDSDFRFDSTLGSTGGYVFNLKTTGLSTGTYILNFTVSGDSFTYAAPFQVK
jgi:hypothetical protein